MKTKEQTSNKHNDNKHKEIVCHFDGILIKSWFALRTNADANFWFCRRFDWFKYISPWNDHP